MAQAQRIRSLAPRCAAPSPGLSRHALRHATLQSFDSSMHYSMTQPALQGSHTLSMHLSHPQNTDTNTLQTTQQQLNHRLPTIGNHHYHQQVEQPTLQTRNDNNGIRNRNRPRTNHRASSTTDQDRPHPTPSRSRQTASRRRPMGISSRHIIHAHLPHTHPIR